eukprot:1682665-Amphidinium_carterae.1
MAPTASTTNIHNYLRLVQAGVTVCNRLIITSLPPHSATTSFSQCQPSTLGRHDQSSGSGDTPYRCLRGPVAGFTFGFLLHRPRSGEHIDLHSCNILFHFFNHNQFDVSHFQVCQAFTSCTTFFHFDHNAMHLAYHNQTEVLLYAPLQARHQASLHHQQAVTIFGMSVTAVAFTLIRVTRRYTSLGMLAGYAVAKCIPGRQLLLIARVRVSGTGARGDDDACSVLSTSHERLTSACYHATLTGDTHSHS